MNKNKCSCTSNISLVSSSLTFLIKSTNDVVNVVREETSGVQDRGQHCCNSPSSHGLVIGMLVHLQMAHHIQGKSHTLNFILSQDYTFETSLQKRFRLSKMINNTLV